ncbi:MAG: hypothetical protein WCR01_12875 [Bacteroidota bacterium]
MKTLKFIWFLLLPFALEGQNWQNICSPGTTYFIDSYDTLQDVSTKLTTPCRSEETGLNVFKTDRYGGRFKSAQGGQMHRLVHLTGEYKATRFA